MGLDQNSSPSGLNRRISGEISGFCMGLNQFSRDLIHSKVKNRPRTAKNRVQGRVLGAGVNQSGVE